MYLTLHGYPPSDPFVALRFSEYTQADLFQCDMRCSKQTICSILNLINDLYTFESKFFHIFLEEELNDWRGTQFAYLLILVQSPIGQMWKWKFTRGWNKIDAK